LELYGTRTEICRIRGPRRFVGFHVARGNDPSRVKVGAAGVSRTRINPAALAGSGNFAPTLARTLAPFEGQRFLGVVDGCGVVEIVFDGSGRGISNLLSIEVKDGDVVVWHGSVTDPESYTGRSRER
jgi:hypothetical protein